MEYYVSMVLRVDPEAPFLSVYGDHREEILDRIKNALFDVDEIAVTDITVTEDD